MLTHISTSKKDTRNSVFSIFHKVFKKISKSFQKSIDNIHIVWYTIDSSVREEVIKDG